MLAALVQVLILAAPPRTAGRAAAPACPAPDADAAAPVATYAPALDDTGFARCSGDPSYLFANDGDDVTKSFLLDSNSILRERAGFESAVHELAAAVNGLWVGTLDRRGVLRLGPCGDDFLRFVYDAPLRPGDEQRMGTAATGGPTILALLRALGFEDEAIWGPQESSRVHDVISNALGAGIVEGVTVGPDDEALLLMLRVGNVVEVRSAGGVDWFMVASRPQAVADGGEREWRFMAVHGGGSLEGGGGRGSFGAQYIRTARMRARHAGGRWQFTDASACGRGARAERALGRYYVTWEAFRTQTHPLPPRLPLGSLVPDLPMSGDWDPWPDLFPKAADAPTVRAVQPARTRR